MNLLRAGKIALASLREHRTPRRTAAEPTTALPPAFLLGVATSSHQVEGGNDNDWTEWERTSFPDGRPHIRDGSASGLATDSWNRFPEDHALLKNLGANAYRFSVEWSRLEPAEGQWDLRAALRYLRWARALRESGVTPMVTLHHFTLPRWVAALGGWQSDTTVELFAAFAGRVARLLGPEVDLWCTINEPNVLAVEGFLEGISPPGLRDPIAAARAFARMLEAHARAARAIRENDAIDADGDGHATRIGVAHHVRILDPASRWSPLDRLVAGFADQFFNEEVVSANRTGRVQITVPGVPAFDVAVPGLAGSFDWLGVNYYTRERLAADLKGPSFYRLCKADGAPTSDLGWELYPHGLYRVLMRFADQGLPIYVTENGMADADGERRGDFLRAHFAALTQAVRDGADVRGYFHWSLLDNFEWAEGFAPRFGLYRVDYDSPERARTPTPAVAVFQDLARSLGLSPGR